MKYNNYRNTILIDNDDNWLYEDSRTGKIFVKVKKKALGVLNGVNKDKYIVNQYLFPLDVFVKIGYGKIHLNATGLKFLSSINQYQIDSDLDLSIFKKIDVVYDKNGDVSGVHYHNEIPMKDKNNNILHDSFHRVDSCTKRLLKKIKKIH